MPRFFFHHANGLFDPDCEGCDLPNLAAARIEAIRLAGELARDRPREIWDERIFRVEVSDETGMLLCTVIILGLDAPAARGLRQPPTQNGAV